MADYTYTVFDGHPAQSGQCSWPDHEDLEFEADDEVAARDHVQNILEVEAAGLDEPDYSPGDQIWALIWDSDGTVVDMLSAEITDDD